MFQTRRARPLFLANLLFGVFLSGAISDVAAQETLRPGGVRLLTAALREGRISVDGRLEEADWAQAQPATEFVAQLPTEGATPLEPTEVRVLYDGEALYIGARLFESDPAQIRSQLVRRDQEGASDYFAVLLDSNLDRRTGYYFQVSSAGVQGDRFLYDDTSEDSSWDAVWESAVHTDAEGWSVEIRIPFARLRTEASPGPQTWGINFHRRRVVSNELLHFSLASRLQQGQVSQFGQLTDVRMTESPRNVEILPYVNAATRTGPSQVGNPFFSGRASSLNTGGELRWGLGGNFTLNATFNPDFGQVESDPAVINLTAFETFFPERRPFFVEDRQLFDFPLSGGTRLFFSRRIGLAPRGRSPSEADFSDLPSSSRILGAAKLTGRTSGGRSVGVLTAVTQEARGRAYAVDGDRTWEFPVEPQTVWAVGGMQQDFNGGDSQVGALLVGLQRDLTEGASYGPLPRTAMGAGLNFLHRWGNREWALSGTFGSSLVRGSPEAILRIQQDPTHYFQRPDAKRVSLDPNRTDLRGVEWRVQVGRQRGDHWTGDLWVGQVHPGIALNDFGFSRDPESINYGARLVYQEIRPGDLFRSYQITLFSTGDWSHDVFADLGSGETWRQGRIQGRYRVSANLQLLNFWRLNPAIGYYPSEYSRTITRGGPVMKIPGYAEAQFSLTTDQRRALNVRPSLTFQKRQEDGGHLWSSSMQMQLRPRSNLELALTPSLEVRRDGAQFAARTRTLPFEPTFGERFLFADVERREISTEIRMNLAFTPTLTVQLFAQPLLASGDFESYKQLSAPNRFRFDRFQEGEVELKSSEIFCSGGQTCEEPSHLRHVDFDGDGRADFSFRDLDFNVRSLILNSVLRWEFQPGSTLFLVWQRFQRERDTLGDFSFTRDLDRLLGAPTENTLSLKVSYWMGL